MGMISLLLVVLPGVLLTPQVQSRAVNITSSWTLPQEGFPHFFRYFKTQITWVDAKHICESFQSELITVESNERRDAARAYLKELDVVDNVWCGLERLSIEAPFVWTGGGKEALVGDGFWQEANSLEPEQQCVAINPLYDFRWQRFPCSGPQLHSFVCQLSVPEWALGEDGCLLKSLPSLTVTYLPEPGVIELLSDCGLSGTKRIACKGGESQIDLMKRLSCDRDDEARSSTLGWTERSSRGHHDTYTTSDWGTQMTKSWGTRHKRESGATSPPTETTGTSHTGETATSGPIQPSLPSQPVEITSSVSFVRADTSKEDKESEFLKTTINETNIPSTPKTVASQPVLEPGDSHYFETSHNVPETSSLSSSTTTTTHQSEEVIDNDSSNEIPVLAVETSGISKVLMEEQSEGKSVIEEVITRPHIAADLTEEKPLTNINMASQQVFGVAEITSAATQQISIDSILTIVSTSSPLAITHGIITPKPEEIIEQAAHATTLDAEIGVTESPELSFLGDISEDVVILDERTQDADEDASKHQLPLTEPKVIQRNPLILTTNTHIPTVENKTSEKIEVIPKTETHDDVFPDISTSTAYSISINPLQINTDEGTKKCKKLQIDSELTIDIGNSETESSRRPSQSSQNSITNLPIIVIEHLEDGESREVSVIENVKITTSESEAENVTLKTAETVQVESATTEKAQRKLRTKLYTDEENNATHSSDVDPSTDRPSHTVTQTPVQLVHNGALEQEKATTMASRSSEPKDTSFERITHLPFQEESSQTDELALEEPVADELENPKRPNRGRLFPHSNPLSFYPYFLNRVLG